MTRSAKSFFRNLIVAVLFLRRTSIRFLVSFISGFLVESKSKHTIKIDIPKHNTDINKQIEDKSKKNRDGERIQTPWEQTHGLRDHQTSLLISYSSAATMIKSTQKPDSERVFSSRREEKLMYFFSVVLCLFCIQN